MIRAIRAATTIDTDTPAAIREALTELLDVAISANGITEESILTILMTVTQDIQSDSPARCVREILGWQFTPILCSLEPDTKGFPALCIRLLFQFETQRNQEELKFIYQKKAISLRPDLARN